MIPRSISLPWRGSIATIPTGWQRDTELDAYFAKMYAIFGDPLNIAGGSTTHIHVSPAHTHVMQSHTHYGQTSRDGNFETRGGSYQCARDAHVHDYTSDGPTGGSLSSGFNYGSGSNIPPYHDLIFIKPIQAFAPLRPNICALWAGIIRNQALVTDAPNGFTFQSDVANKYMRGANNAAEAGGEGGSLTHTHDVSHTHPNAVHSHAGRTGYDSDANSDNKKDGQSGGGSCCDRHTHALYLSDISEAATSYSATLTSGTVEPKYLKLGLIKNTSGKSIERVGIVGIYKGLPGKIPIGWVPLDGRESLADARDRYIKFCATLAEIGSIGGAHSHAHPDSNSHTHSATGQHRHTGGTDHFPQTGTTTADNNGVSQGHSHQINDSTGRGWCSYNTSAWNGASMQGLESNQEPPFKTVAFVRLKYSMDGGLLVTGL